MIVARFRQAPPDTLVTTGLIIGIFLAALESSVVTTALPTIVGSLGGGELYVLPYAVYLLASTISGPVWGRLSDLRGRKVNYLLAVALFVLGSALCGASSSMTFLIAARVLQGVGGGGVMPLTLTMIADMYSLERRARIQGFLSGVWGVSALLGPLVGGLISEYMSWRWVFYLNLPFAAGAAYLVARHLNDSVRGRSEVTVDWLGAGLFGAGVGVVIWALELGHVPLGLLSVPLLAGFAWWQTRARSPILPPRAFRDGFVRLGLAGNFFAGMAYFGLIAYLPLYAQGVSGAGAVAAGALLTPTSVAWTLASIIAARLLPSMGARRITVFGSALLVIGFLAFRLALGTPLVVLALCGIITGFGMGFTMFTLLISVQAAVPKPDLGVITSSLLFMRTVGGSVGSALMGALIGEGIERGGALLAAGLGRAFWLAVGLAVATLLVSLALPRTEPDAATR